MVVVVLLMVVVACELALTYWMDDGTNDARTQGIAIASIEFQGEFSTVPVRRTSICNVHVAKGLLELRLNIA